MQLGKSNSGTRSNKKPQRQTRCQLVLDQKLSTLHAAQLVEGL